MDAIALYKGFLDDVFRPEFCVQLKSSKHFLQKESELPIACLVVCVLVGCFHVWLCYGFIFVCS